MSYSRGPSSLKAVGMTACLLVASCMPSLAGECNRHDPDNVSALLDQATAKGTILIIVKLDFDFIPEGRLDERGLAAQRAAISAAQDSVLDLLGSRQSDFTRYTIVPYLAGPADAGAIEALAESELVCGISEDVVLTPSLPISTELVGATAAWASFDGTGYSVVIMDTGVDNDHPFLSGKIADESCFSTTYGSYTGICPGSDPLECIGPGCADDLCNYGYGYCHHGTHVAGIAAGSRLAQWPYMAGVAKGSSIIAMQVASLDTQTGALGLFVSDVEDALEYLSLQVLPSNPVAAINMSFGSPQFYDHVCDSGTAYDGIKDLVDTLRSYGVATVAASGNGERSDRMSAPACMSSVVSVGNSTKGIFQGGVWVGRDEVFLDSCGNRGSNSADFLDLFAPGSETQDDLCPGVDLGIYSSLPYSYEPNGYGNGTGTSMAAPHVTGAFAVLRQAYPNESVEYSLFRLKETGAPIPDFRVNPPRVKPRIQIDAALAYNQMWVDFGYAGDEFGTRDQPFNTLTEGIAAVPEGGQVNITAQHGVFVSIESPLVISKAVRIESVDCEVTIG